MGNPKHVKSTEKGYLVVFAIFCVLLLTVISAVAYLIYVTKLNYHIAILNNELALQGYFQTIPAVCPDYSVFNWAITAESAAFSIAAAAQASKKKSNNNFMYAEQFIMDFADRYGIEYVSSIITSFLSTNQNNG